MAFFRGTICCSVSLLLMLMAGDSGVFACSGGASKDRGSTCNYGEFECNDNSGCYTDKQKCNDVNDCTDGSDEDSHHCDKEYPTFENVSCSTLGADAKYTLCFKIQFPGDNATDYALLEKVEDAWETYKGYLRDEMNGEVAVAFSYPDKEDDETMATIRFHTLHVAECTDFEIDIEGTSPYASNCLKDHHVTSTNNNDLNDTYAEYEDKIEGVAYRLNSRGYKMKVKVYYDDAMKKTYSSPKKVMQKLRSTMVYVEEMFHEKDTLTTIIDINAKGLKIEHLSGENWESSMSRHLGSTLQKLARNSADENDLYVFVTGKGNGNPLGIAYVGTVCSSSRSSRVSINRYGIPGQQKNKVLYTAETIAHEMGHNLGMRHDFNRKDSRGKNCYGYMDYKDSTNYWSTCSVEDFTKTKKSCLSACDSTCDGVDTNTDDTDDTTTDDDDTGTCENVKSYSKYCDQFKWACTDSRYPWFRTNCKKTCKAC